jgi:hypothetical protein
MAMRPRQVRLRPVLRDIAKIQKLHIRRYQIGEALSKLNGISRGTDRYVVPDGSRGLCGADSDEAARV